jgi:uncharacterized protein (TIGR00730 family)
MFPPPNMRKPASSANTAMAIRMTAVRDKANLRRSGHSGLREEVQRPQSPKAPYAETIMRQKPHANKDKNSVCVFCGSSPGRDPAYAKAARRLGAAIGAQGWGLVFGGGDIGLMGEVAEAAYAAGARVHGVMPEFLRHLEPPLKKGEQLEITPDLQARKGRMLAEAGAFIILPGGLGTLDEFFEVVTSAQLGVLAKPIVVVNTKGYFEPLRALMAHVVREGFARRSVLSLCTFVATPEAAMKAITRPVARGGRAASPRRRSAKVRPKRNRT